MTNIKMGFAKFVTFGLCGALLAGCVTMVEHLVPQASINEKQFDFVADIELHYAGNVVHARRHYQYFLFRIFNQSGKEIRRELPLSVLDM
jgi:hypothetical protein